MIDSCAFIARYDACHQAQNNNTMYHLLQYYGKESDIPEYDTILCSTMMLKLCSASATRQAVRKPLTDFFSTSDANTLV